MVVDKVRELLEMGLHPSAKRLYAKNIDELTEGFGTRFATDHWGLIEASPQLQLGQQLFVFLECYIDQTRNRWDSLRLDFTKFRETYARAARNKERRELIIGLAHALGADRRQLIGDRRAFKRWFGYDAICERCRRREAVYERNIAFALGRLGAIAAFLLREGASYAYPARLWRRMELERVIRPWFAETEHATVRIESFRCLAAALQALPAELRESSVTDRSLMYIYRMALDASQDTWLQCEALSVLKDLSGESLEKALRLRLAQPRRGDDLFVRRHAVRVLGAELEANPALCTLLATAAADPSPAVRQSAAAILCRAPEETVCSLLPQLSLEAESEPAVRAAALCAMGEFCVRPELTDIVCNALCRVLEQEKNSFVLRVALKAAVDGFTALEARPEDANEWLETLSKAIAALHTGAEDLAVRRWAAQARERMWSRAVPEARALLDALAPLLEAIPKGRSKRVRRRLLRAQNEDVVGRALSSVAQRDFGFDVEDQRFWPRINRGHRFGFRLWRFLYEMSNPATDKRQAFPHTVGRIFRGRLRVPSAIVSEIDQTKVPGEPLFMPSEHGWRPYLPLIDEMISALDQPDREAALKIYTSEGVTEVSPPRSLWRRFRARLLLTFQFNRYAKLRNWREGMVQSCEAYIAALQRLGFGIRFRPYPAQGAIPSTQDPAVKRFFPAVLPLPLMDVFAGFKDYFFSVYENSLQELMIFLALSISWFMGRHIWLSRKIRRLRNAIPLVIGGWGTRGKSGTERLKAALFNALGHSVVSKTTGCEVMFLHGHANGVLREMFLFRPYDKATIWEQVNVVRIARQLGAHVFLWECMGLTPSYVAIMQRQWMRDDLSTITNTYPDHEDLQGPAGINISEVVTRFIPHDSTLITTEEQMLPILRSAAQSYNTRVRSVGWLAAGLLAPDILARFSYAEHPYNIALVLEMADELGIDKDFALKEMADRVVPDLGVLKATPVVSVRSRRIEFINGMSANDRFACLGSWERMGLSDQDPYQDPGVWLSTVVNNRADRVPRSKVFAGILVKDIGADRHFLIGTNLGGLLSYIREAWDEHVSGLSLVRDTDGRRPLEVLEASAQRLRIPFREAHVTGRVRAMLEGCGLSDAERLASYWPDRKRLRMELIAAMDEAAADDFLDHVHGIAQGYVEYRGLAVRVASTPPDPVLDAVFLKQLWKWFEKKLVVIEDPHASGDQIIDRLVANSLPGLYTRVMGLQNIKGIGLDFVYCWQAWEICHKACADLLSEEPAIAERGLRALAGFPQYNMLCEVHLRESIETVRHSAMAQDEWFQTELKVILANLENAIERIETHLRSSERRHAAGFLSWILAQIEAFLDVGDAVKRRKTADKIYRDLATERISHERAALELQGLSKRQRGGWLQKNLEALMRLGRS